MGMITQLIEIFHCPPTPRTVSSKSATSALIRELYDRLEVTERMDTIEPAVVSGGID